ncbi:hypothetical protein CR152_20000 [Massilia violaceinigra]|uniref:Uncharacterized protein n=1 Tax=Massilia violaceinigra TaxID=2045208 RepID=A0A2D2DNJ9_9BURK|nr:hypothetical protein [Massilia violaceinigra]ATQ76541.1 hypothetical protein CR152_20000 [Massilia violaceinigra]
MQEICDIYLIEKLSGSSKLLQQLRIFDPTIAFDENQLYLGFLGLNLKRLTNVAILMNFKSNGIRCFNIPVRYRSALISQDEARIYAEIYMDSVGGTVICHRTRPGVSNPMFWYFLVHDPRENSVEPREGGGNLTVDSFDGHIWTCDEAAEYHYDYNNSI